MGLLDRLDAIDRRLGIDSRPKMRAPRRLERRLANHPWRGAAVWAVLTSIPQVMAWLLASGDLADVVISAVVQFPFGYLLARMTRNRVQAWDQTVPPEAGPHRDE